MLTVRAPLAPMHGEPRVSASMISQLLAGAPLESLQQQGDWHRVRGRDGYEGWVHRGYLTAASGSESTWRLSLGCTVREATGDTRMLPVGARVSPSAEVIGGEAIDAVDQTTRFPTHGSAIVETARRYFGGASYLWGGGSPWGCDCSGLVQTVFALHGVQLPRDAWQQALVGRDAVANAPDDVDARHAAGTLLFFSDREDRRITHVGIATGDGAMIHSALSRGGFAVDDLSSDEDYVRRMTAGCTAIRAVIDDDARSGANDG